MTNGLALIQAFISIMFETDEQDKHMTLEAVEFMISAVRQGQEFDLDYVIAHYVDVMDSDEARLELHAQIRHEADNYATLAD